MNEVDFAALSRTFESGTTVLFFSKIATIDRRFSPALNTAVAAGVVFRFVDPAKPLLVYRRADGSATGFDFFQDVLYASEPGIVAARFALWKPSGGEGNVPALDRWIGNLEAILRHPLRSDTELFDAYSAGLMGKDYNESGHPDEELGAWMRRHLGLLSVTESALTPVGETKAIWEGHDVYSFS